MIRLHNLTISVMVMYIIMLHVVWAFALMYDESGIGATAVNALHRYIQSIPLLIFVLLAASVLSLWTIFSERLWTTLLALPQQALIMMSAAGAIEAIWLQQFADGVVRPFGFILVDQVHIILGALGHTTALIALAWHRYE